MNDIAISFGPFLKEIDRVVEVCDFEDQILPFTQVNWPVKHLRLHFYLTKFVGSQLHHYCPPEQPVIQGMPPV